MVFNIINIEYDSKTPSLEIRFVEDWKEEKVISYNYKASSIVSSILEAVDETHYDSILLKVLMNSDPQESILYILDEISINESSKSSPNYDYPNNLSLVKVEVEEGVLLRHDLDSLNEFTQEVRESIIKQLLKDRQMYHILKQSLKSLIDDSLYCGLEDSEDCGEY